MLPVPSSNDVNGAPTLSLFREISLDLCREVTLSLRAKRYIFLRRIFPLFFVIFFCFVCSQPHIHSHTTTLGEIDCFLFRVSRMQKTTKKRGRARDWKVNKDDIVSKRFR